MSRTTVRRLLDGTHPPKSRRGIQIDDRALGKLARALLAYAYEELERRNRTAGEVSGLEPETSRSEHRVEN